MACVNPDGTLTPSALAVLKAVKQAPQTAEALAALVGLPLFRVRSSLRELREAGLLIESGGVYHLTPQGEETLKKQG
ncbi:MULTISPECIES: hypothetical protein [Anaerolinea]|uniref:hypothetical protein n=1 Tax=Anaerolinea TaxID=233189 RepID=UPI002606C7C3|nr:hypothetical protein [Anaerolinea thermophila]